MHFAQHTQACSNLSAVVSTPKNLPMPRLLLKHVYAHCCYDLDGNEYQGPYPVAHGSRFQLLSAAAGTMMTTRVFNILG